MIRLSKALNNNSVTIRYTATAWQKIFTMAELCERNECAAFGKITKEDDVYTVHDIYIYPQLITGTTVTSDDDAYVKWLLNLPEDAQTNLKFQVHSHVKMAVNPSNVDLPTYARTVETIPEDDFILFMIVNQRKEYSLRLYSKADDLIYDEDDLVVEIITDDGQPINDWYFTEEKKYIKEKTSTYLGYHIQKYVSDGMQDPLESKNDGQYGFEEYMKARNATKGKAKTKTKPKVKHSMAFMDEEAIAEAILKGTLVSTDQLCPDCGRRLYLNARENKYYCLQCGEAYTKKELKEYGLL